MSANCICCENTLKVGCFHACEEYNLSIPSPANDDYSFQMEFNGRIIHWTQEVLIGNNFIIPEQYVNQDYEHIVKIFFSDGTRFTLTVADVVYDCFRFRVTPAVHNVNSIFEGTPHTPFV